MEKAQIEVAAKEKVEQAEREKAEAVKKSTAEAATKIEAAKLEGQKVAEARIAAAEKAKAAAEMAKADAEAAAAQRLAEAEQAAQARQEESQKQLETANNEKAQALAKVKETEAERDAADARAAQKIATEKAQIEAAAKAKVEQAEREKAEALKKADAEAAAQIEAAKAEGRKLGEAGFEARITAAEKAKAEAEKAKTDAEIAAAQKVAVAEQAAKARQEEAQKQLEAANTEKAGALAKVKEVEAERDAAIETRVREVREAMEKHEGEALAKKDFENDEKTRKLLVQVQTLERKLEEKRPDELGEGAHIQLLDALRAEFPGDDIRRIRPGVSGADILHTVMRNGMACGSILWESKNSMGWQYDYVTKLIRDQTAARADHAILSTFKFPAGTSQVAIFDGVVIVNPARAVAIAHMIRTHLLLVHTLRLSKAERMEKMAALYDFMTSPQCALLLGRIDSDAEALLDLQVAEKKFHDKHWEKQALRYKSIQKAKADLDIEVGAIIGGVELVG